MKKISKLLALALALCLIFSCISVVAFAAETDSYERTLLSLASASDIITYDWMASDSETSWDSTENAYKFYLSEANVGKSGVRFQTKWYYFPMRAGATYTLTLKAKGATPGDCAMYAVNSDSSSDLSSTTNWIYKGIEQTITPGETDAEGYTEYTYVLNINKLFDEGQIFADPKEYCGSARFFVSMPKDHSYTAYIKDLKLVANKSTGKDYVTTDYMFLNQWKIEGVPLFRYGTYYHTEPVVSTDADGDKIWKLNMKDKIMLAEAYTFDANTKYRLSFDAWLDESCPSSYESKSNIGILFDSAANKYTQTNFTISKTRKHFDLVFDTATLGEAAAFSTVNLQLRIGANDYPEDYIYYITDIRLQKYVSNTVDTLVKVSGNGSVKKSTANVDYALSNGESLPAVSGTAVTLDVVPKSGYQIASVTYNNADITPANREAASQITINPTSDAVLNVKFEEIPPKIPALVKGENTKAESFTLGGTVYNNVNYIQYAKIDNYSASDVEGAGVTVSNGTDSLDLPAVGISADGSFAIRVFGDAITADGTYTFTPFMNVK